MIRLFVILILLAMPEIAQAGFLDTIECISTDNTNTNAGVVAGGCTLEDVSIGLIQLIQLLLSVVGAVALFFMAYGAFYWVTSMGFPTRVKRGQDIMLNTIFALMLVLSSYIILEFFVNRLLNVDDEYRIRSQCTDQSEGTVCNSDLGINYVCDGEGNCITKCNLRARDMEQRWECTYIEYPGYVEANPQLFEANLCPNDEHYVCTQVDHPDYAAFLEYVRRFGPGPIFGPGEVPDT